MSKRSVWPPAEPADLTLHLLQELFNRDEAHQVGMRLWKDTRSPDESPRPAALVPKHPGALRAKFPPGTELALADEMNVSLIALGSHRRGAIQEMLAGSTFENVARLSRQPVPVVRHPPGERAGESA